MILTLLRSRLRPRSLRWPALFVFLLGAAVVFAYSLPLMADLRIVRAELPEVFTALGFFADHSLHTHIASYLFGFAMPFMMTIFGVYTAASMVSRPLDDGRMAVLLSAPYRRSAVLFTLGLAVLLSGLLLCLAALLGQLLASLILFPGADFMAIFRVNAGFMLVSALCGALPLLIATLSTLERSMRRRSHALMLLQLALLLASRVQGFTKSFRYLTFWSLFDSTALALGGGGFPTAGVAFALALAAVSLALFLFERREI